MKIKKILLVLTAAVFLLTLVSCTEDDGSAYLSEEVISSIEKDSKKWAELSDMLGALTVNSADIPEFDSMSQSAKYFRDSLLNYLCCKNYRKYAGDAELLGDINEKYPELDAVAAIEADEFEAEMYRLFGGSIKITHKSTELFTYLDKSDVYVPITSPVYGGCDLVLVSAEETEHTYRLEFETYTDRKCFTYFALLVKRDDGSCYFSLLLKK
ncbi:MAG: hypothetical protein IKM46_06365 [Clostridia bacterium]|nr:hypothetical protein [Clostridia bacterium]